jgi:Flp pilus assembly protein TadB
MKPSYQEIIEVNSRLKNRSKEEVEKLLDTIISKGYSWDDKKKYFYHEKLGMHVRTQGLDLFDAERFEKAFQTWSSPNHAKGAKIGQKYIPIFFLVFIIDLISGWLLMPIGTWIITLVVLLVLIFVIRKTARNKIRLS